MARHSHKFTIADEDAVRALVTKLADGGKHMEKAGVEALNKLEI